jgi:hypothetical protein
MEKGLLLSELQVLYAVFPRALGAFKSGVFLGRGSLNLKANKLKLSPAPTSYIDAVHLVLVTDYPTPYLEVGIGEPVRSIRIENLNIG